MGTSEGVFDGSGKVRMVGNRQTTLFRNEKWYNCDLSASYNIGARYWIREIVHCAEGLTGNGEVAGHGQLPDPVARHQQTLLSLIALSGCSLAERSGLVPDSCLGSRFPRSRHYSCCLVVGGYHLLS